MDKYKYFTNTGIIVPDTSEILEEVREEFRQVFGQDLDTSSETPQGVLIAAETIARRQMIENNAALANQINPNQAGGIFLDALFSLMGGERIKASPSTVRGVILKGQPGTHIEAGALASTQAGILFKLISSVQIGEDGSVKAVFQSVECGEIALEKGALNTIVTGILGWESVYNPLPAQMGNKEESDSAARIRRRRTIASRSIALPEAISSALYALEGVKSVSFLENPEKAPQEIGGVTLAPNSIYVCVDGGEDKEIAQVLLEKKSLGCTWNGKHSVEVIEPISKQAYRVKFDRPKEILCYVRVTIRLNSAVSNPELLIREAILSYAEGKLAAEEGFNIGKNISPFLLAAAIHARYPDLYVADLQISKDGKHYTREEMEILVDEKALVTQGLIEVKIL